MIIKAVALLLLLLLLPCAALSQSLPANIIPSTEGLFPNDYRLGPDDVIDVAVFEIPELGGTARVSSSGSMLLPYVGTIDATGKTLEELKESIESALKAKHVNDPHVTVFIREYAPQPVAVLGAVKLPGVYQIRGQKLLLDVLAMAQGLNESAGKSIQVIRRGDAQGTLSVPTATSGGETIVVDVTELFQNGNTALNIPVHSGDVINVLNGGSIFAVGEFQRPGEFTLRYGRDITVSQAVALGGGLNREAQKQQAVVIRPHADGSKEQIPVNLGKIFDGSGMDIPLMANDVLFVPASKLKTSLNRTLDSIVSIVIGRAIYAR